MDYIKLRYLQLILKADNCLFLSQASTLSETEQLTGCISGLYKATLFTVDIEGGQLSVSLTGEQPERDRAIYRTHKWTI